MDRLIDTFRHFGSVIIERLESVVPLSVTQLLWTAGAAAILLPAATYAWWMQKPVTSSEKLDDLTSVQKAESIEEPAQVKLDSELHAETENTSAPQNEQSYSPPVQNSVETELHINGQEIPLPPEGTVHKEIYNDNGKTSVDISIQSSSSGTSHSRSSTNIELNSRTRSEGTHVD